MSTKTKLQELTSQLTAQKEELLKEVLADKSLSKLEKLQEIRDNELWGYHGWVGHIFQKQEKAKYDELKAAAKEGEYVSSCSDDVICGDHLERHQKVDVVEFLEEQLPYMEEKQGDSIIVSRFRDGKNNVTMTSEQIIDAVYEWCLDKKAIGFIFDW